MSSSTTVAPSPLVARRSRSRWGELGFQGLTLFALLLALAILLVLLFDIVTAAIPVYQERGWEFLTTGLSSRASRTGLVQGLIGSFQIAILTALVAFPLGIATAVYLEEYATHGWFHRIVDVNIRNLAGVPSIVYGLLGLFLFVRILGPRDLGGFLNLTGGRTALSAGLTMGLLALPIVVITAAEAIRAVPRSLREGGYGLGATRWEVTSKLVLPNAAPGMLTGMILALSRAIGETAPLLVVGAFTFLSTVNTNLVDSLREPYTALPLIVFNWAKRPQREFVDLLAPAAILVLLVFTLSMNFLAIWLRNRYERRQHG
jgi:phosphate transport system permease protein